MSLILSINKEVAVDSFIPFVTNVLIDVMLELGRENAAKKLLSQLPRYMASSDALDSAILARRLGRQEAAHHYFERAGDAVLYDPRALHEFAQTKIRLAQNLLHPQAGGHRDRESNKRLLREAKELLERLIQMDADKTRHAWAWRDLGRVKKWLKATRGEVKDAYEHAIELLPDEFLFKKELAQWEETANDEDS